MTVRDVERALRTALSRGGDWAELFWERSETLQLVLDDQRIEDAITGVDQGAGVRVVHGEQDGVRNGNVTDADDVHGDRGSCGEQRGRRIGRSEGAKLVPDELPRPHSVAIEPRTVPVEKKSGTSSPSRTRFRTGSRPACFARPRPDSEIVQEILVANSEGSTGPTRVCA